MPFRFTAPATSPLAIMGSTELNPASTGLANNTNTPVTATIDFTTTSYRALYAMFNMTVTFGTAPTANTQLQLFALPSLDDGTTFPDGSASITPSGTLLIASFLLIFINEAF